MLSKADIQMIKDTRREITRNRTTVIDVVYPEIVGDDPISEQPIIKPLVKSVDAVTTEMSSVYKLDFTLEDGIHIENGDLKAVIDLRDLAAIEVDPDAITDLKYMDEEYKVIHADKRGIGELNRIILVGRKVS